MGSWLQIQSLEGELDDQLRIVKADEALLEVTKSPEKRDVLVREIAAAEDKIERLRRQIEDLRHPTA